MMELCWNQIPLERPSFVKIRDQYLKKILGNTKENIVDQLLKRMDQYSNTLEKKVAEKTQQLLEEKKRTDELLHTFLPGGTIDALTRGEPVEPELIPSVTVYFGTMVDLAEVCRDLTPACITSLMNAVDSLVEGTVERHELFKVKGYVGDGYMMVSGILNRLPTAGQIASSIATAAMHLQKEVQSFYHPDMGNQMLQLRAGMASGAVVAGIVGSRIPQYYLFGQTVVTARLMETSGHAMKIQVADSTKQLLPQHYDLQERADKIKSGEGSATYWLISSHR
ncbi:hypothetical protein RvY_17572-3 [Ramazzottius varieornatus]|uniref:Guanylate cyclase domain-containing protein n=1 Tax=Ramazzottius varieornatus TaxID=947166 RepID=A0A1D1W9I8_RAMVA|nr:hypothetical protein RvY_17572-3 [Ramazzottius varieornatus]